MKTIWKDCVKEPSELGKKVLCQRKGDFYVSMRIEEYYIPIPFADHYFCKKLCKPEMWCEINFPEQYTGYIRVIIDELGYEPVTLSKAREINHHAYWNLANRLIKSIGKIPVPEGMKL